MTNGDLARGVRDILRRAGIEEYGTESRLILENAGISGTDVLVRPDEEADGAAAERAMDLAGRRAQTRRPLQYLLGEAWFYGRRFAVDDRCLIPRPDTEVLCEEAIDLLAGMRDPAVLDMCTGSGCIAVTVSLEAGCHVDAADISEDALDVARCNIEALGADVTLFRGDMFAAVTDRVYDMIICNPPYINPDDAPELEPEVREYEPRQALFAGDRGLAFYRRIAREAAEHLRGGGRLLLEIGSEQAEEVTGILRAGGFSCLKVRKDYSGCDRVVSAVWNKGGV